ncbi:MAG: lamin tail domain-containing protein, partial [Vicingaceae bacterium]|nr:lamin tail domain-containing protein [Vicingaceae bacterium]
MLHKLLFITCLCLGSVGFSQFTDDFTDGDFTNNPTWSGDNALFTAATGVLNSQNTGANNYYLSTPSTMSLNAQWDFYFNMMFGTSGVNYVDVYLTSDVSDVTNPNNGYFVRIGGTPDEVSLYKMVGGTPTILIDGPDGVINSTSNNPFNVRVTRDIANNWTLEYDDGVLGPYTNVGSIVDNSFSTSAFFGISITQSAAASPINNHFFDNISVGAIVGDTSAPVVDSLVVVNTTNLDVYFNEGVDLTTSQTLTNYTADGGLGNPTNAQRDVLDSSIVHLTFATAFTNSQPYNLTITNVEDTASNAITSIVEPFIYVVIIVPNAGDVLINEIFADPSPQVGLPGEEFVELYNKSNNAYILNNWQFVNTTTPKTLPNFALLPNSYVILCDVNDTNLYSSYGDVIGISSFTALTNGGDSLTLMDDNSNVIDIVAYDISWYNDPSKDDGGYTLELINPKHPCTSSVNWIASADVAGGTPGTQNSVFDTLPDTQNPIISNVDIISATQLNVVFNEIMDSASLANATYAINNGISVTGSVINPNNQEVGLTVSPALDSSTVYTLTITGGNDCSGNSLNPNTINFGIGKAPLKYEVVITELFPDPSPTIGLPTE